MNGTFGAAWSRMLLKSVVSLSALGHPVDPEWILTLIALESAGTWDPTVLQARATLEPASGAADSRAEVIGTGGLRLSHGTGARGLFQQMPQRWKRAGMPDLIALYAPSDAIVQLIEGCRALERQSIAGAFGGFRTREALYCANIAPARLIDDAWTDETILYSADAADAALNAQGARFTKTFWPAAYVANARAFGRVSSDTRGKLRMRDLAVGLDGAARASRARIDRELTAAYALNASG